MTSALFQDFRYALRSFLKSPVFATVAVLSLALGIGANTAIFSLLDQVLLRLLPVKDPREIVRLAPAGGNFGIMYGPGMFSAPVYRGLRDRNNSFSGVFARFGTAVAMTHQNSTERVDAEIVTGNYFEVLGVKAAMGRLITPDDDRTPGAHPVAVLSHQFWQARFAGNPNILGQTLRFNGHPMTVIGVAARGFRGMEVGASSQVFVPLMMKAQMTPTWNGLEDYRASWLSVFARLKPGITASQAASAMEGIFRQLNAEDLATFPAAPERVVKRYQTRRLEVRDGGAGLSELRDQFSMPLIVLMVMVGLVLLIACANVANLLVARAASRQKEIAVRLAIGASRGRIMRQLVAESLLLALIGGGLGLMIAWWGGDLLLSFLPFEAAARSFSTAPDWRILGFNLAVSLLAGLLFGLAPAIQATKPDLAPTLKLEASAASPGGGTVRFRKVLVAGQIALSLLLLIGAGLFTRSLMNLRALDLGFRSDSLLTFSVDPSLSGYPQSRVQDFYRRLTEQLSALPGVRSVSLGAVAALTTDRAMMTVRVEGYEPKEGESMNPDVNTVGPDYFRTFGSAVVKGREFTWADKAGAPKVCIVNERFAKYFFGNQNPLGRKIGRGRDNPNVEIVGVVQDQKSVDMRGEPLRHVYFPHMQEEAVTQMTFYVNGVAGGEFATLAAAVRREVQKLDAALPVFQVKPLKVTIDEFLFTERLVASLSAFFGLLATLLAAIGLYGVMAYSVARRTREIGIHIALGAERSRVLWLVMKEVTLLSVIGIACGLPGAVGLSTLVRSQLFGVQPVDLATFGLSTAVLAATALLAGYIPAERATRVDPMRALRYE